MDNVQRKASPISHFGKNILPPEVIQSIKDHAEHLTAADRKVMKAALGIGNTHIVDSSDNRTMVRLDDMTDDQLETLYLSLSSKFADDFIDPHIEHRDNVVDATDMLEFLQSAFLTDDSGVMLSASAARGVGSILRHIQTVMVENLA